MIININVYNVVMLHLLLLVIVYRIKALVVINYINSIGFKMLEIVSVNDYRREAIPKFNSIREK